jgi:hypothetical protein
LFPDTSPCPWVILPSTNHYKIFPPLFEITSPDVKLVSPVLELGSG